MVIVHAWESFQETFEARASEWALAAAMVSLAIVTMLNKELFGPYDYSGVKSILTQDTWALVFLTVGALRIVTLGINGAYWRTPHFRSFFAFISCFVWFNLALGFAWTLGWGVAIFPWLFLLDAFNAARAGREAGVAQFLHRQKKAPRHDRKSHA